MPSYTGKARKNVRIDLLPPDRRLASKGMQTLLLNTCSGTATNKPQIAAAALSAASGAIGRSLNAKNAIFVDFAVLAFLFFI